MATSTQHPPAPSGPPAATPETPVGRRRAITALVSFTVMAVLLLGSLFVPVPYVIESPGPTFDVLGARDGQKILDIQGHEQYPTSGKLLMTTVSVDGGPGYTVTPVEVIWAWFDPDQAVLPREAVFPAGETQQQTTRRNAQEMTSSQQDAIAVALEQLGIAYTTQIVVGSVLAGGPADGVLEPDDVIVSVQGQPAADVATVQRLVRAVPAGSPVSVVVQRDGAQKELSVPTQKVEGQTRMGVELTEGYDFPLDVTVTVKDVGGPSAGTIFALAVYDELTPGELTGGEAIAGTGTIDEEGTVGAIGGIRQKMAGAREDGADYFLAPAANCDDVVGHVPEGLHVVKVSTFQDALTATETIGREHSADGLPTCTP